MKLLSRRLRPFMLFLVLACITAIPSAAMTINVTYNANGCVTTGCVAVPGAAQTAFNSVIALYDSMFTNNAQVFIEVQFGTTGLGQSNTQIDPNNNYSQWRTLLQTDSTANPGNSFLSAGFGTLPSGSNPLGGGQTLTSKVDFTTANGKALGLVYGTNAGAPDSTITFNKSATYEFNQTATPGAFDFIGVAEHELDEALGIGSNLTGIADNGALPANFFSEDYFRYNATPIRAVTTDPTASSFFSYNGSTLVAQFNQANGNGDRNDWIYGNSGCPATTLFVQNADACPNQVSPSPFAVGSPESLVLQTLGWDLTPSPEPSTIVLMSLGCLAILGVARRKRA